MADLPANDDMVKGYFEGYFDGFKDDRDDFPESLSNRGAAYRHGWLNGRDDRHGTPRAAAADLRAAAQTAMAQDALPSIASENNHG